MCACVCLVSHTARHVHECECGVMCCDYDNTLVIALYKNRKNEFSLCSLHAHTSTLMNQHRTTLYDSVLITLTDTRFVYSLIQTDLFATSAAVSWAQQYAYVTTHNRRALTFFAVFVSATRLCFHLWCCCCGCCCWCSFCCCCCYTDMRLRSTAVYEADNRQNSHKSDQRMC